MPDFLTTSIFQQYSSVTACMILILVSGVCGVYVGYEREKKQKPAGIKTMALVSIGSTIFTILSHQMSSDISDPTRIAAQVISGIGFLGAGAVMRGDGYIRGLTTAATIWAVAAIGMVIGFGYPFGGMGLSVIVFSILQGARYLEKTSAGPCEHQSATIFFDNSDGRGDVKIFDILEDSYIYKENCEIDESRPEMTSLKTNYCTVHKHHKSFLIRLTEIDEVKKIIS